MDGGDPDPAERHANDLVLPAGLVDLGAVPPCGVHRLQSADEEVLHLHPRDTAVRDVLDGVDEAGHNISDLGAELFVHFAVESVDHGGVLGLDPATGCEPVGVHAGFGPLDEDEVVAVEQDGACGALDHGPFGHG